MAQSELRLRRPYKELNLQQLRSFCEVCRLGGYASAARSLKLTSPTVWEQLQALGRHFELELLERDGNRVKPTLQGQRLLELARPLLAGLDSLKSALHQQEGLYPARLVIVSNLRVLAEKIGLAMSEFRWRYPSVRLFVRYAGVDEVQALTLDGSADIALTLEPGPDEPLSPAIAYEPAGELDYLLVTPPGHALLRGKTLRPGAIVRHPLILGGSVAWARHRVQEMFHRHNLADAMNVVVETTSDEYTLACVRAGLGVGITIGYAASSTYQDLGIRLLRRMFGTARVGFMWRRGFHLPRLQREFAELLRANLSRPIQGS